MRPAPIIAAFGLALALAACSKQDSANVQGDLHNTGNDVTAAASEMPQVPAVAQAKADINQTVSDAKTAAQDAAANVKSDAGNVAGQLNTDADKAGARVKKAAGDLRGNSESSN